MRRIFVLLVSIILIAISFLIYFYFYKFLPNKIRTEFSKYFFQYGNPQLKFQSINLKLPNILTIDKIYIFKDKFYFKIDSIVLYFNLKNLLKTGDTFKSIKKIYVYKPEINLTEIFSPLSLSKTKNNSYLPNILLVDGKVIYNKLIFKNINGEILFDNQFISVKLKTDIEKFLKDVYIKTFIDNRKNNWYSKIYSVDSEYKFFMNLSGYKDKEIISGKIKTNLEIKNYNLTANGFFSYLNNIFTIDMDSEDNFTLRGNLKNNIVDFYLNFKNFPLNLLSTNFKTGGFDLIVNISSNIFNPVIKGNLKITQEIKTQPKFIPDIFNGLNVKFEYINSNIFINGYFGNKENEWNFNIKNFKTLSYTTDFEFKNIKTDISGRIFWNKEILKLEYCSIKINNEKKLNINGVCGIGNSINDYNFIFDFNNLNIYGISLFSQLTLTGKFKYFEYIQGTLLSKNFYINKNFKNYINCNFVYKDKKLWIENLDVSDFIKSKLYTDFVSNQINGNIKIKNLSINNLTSNNFSGFINSDIILDGTLLNPLININYNIISASFKNYKFNTKGSGKFSDGKLFLGGDFVCKEPIESVKLVFLKDSDIKYNITYYFYSNKLFLNFSNRDISSKLELVLNNISNKNFKIIINNGILKYKQEQEISLLEKSFIDDKIYKLFLNFKNFKLGQNLIYGKLNVNGKYNFKNNDLILNSSFETDNLWVNQYNFINFKFMLNSFFGNEILLTLYPFQNDKENDIKGKITIKDKNIIFDNICIRNKNENIVFKINGSYKNELYNFTIEGENIGAENILSIFNYNIPLNGLIEFTVVLKGNRTSPYFTGILNIYSGNIGYIPFSNFNLQFNFKNNILNITNTELICLKDKKEYLHVFGKGYIPLKDEKEKLNINFYFKKADLSIIESFTEIVKSAKGEINGEILIRGSLSNPYYKGDIYISEGDIFLKKYCDRIKNFNVNLNFSKNRILFKQFNGIIGKGKFIISGYIELDKLFNISEYNLKLYTLQKGIKIYIPELPISIGSGFKLPVLEGIIKNYSYAEPTFSLDLKGKKENPILSGYIVLEKSHFTYPPKQQEKGGISSIFDNLTFDIELKTGNDTWYENELLRTKIDGYLKINGKYNERLKVNGKIQSFKGTINYINNNFDIKDAEFEVINNECYLQVLSETTVGSKDNLTDVIQMVIDRAQIGKIQPKFISKSQPNLSQELVIAKLWGLVENDENGKKMNIIELSPQERSIFFRKQLVRLFDTSLGSNLARSFLSKSGLIDNLHITYLPETYTEKEKTDLQTTNVSLGELLSGTKYSMEKYLTKDIILGYNLTFKQIQKQINLQHEIELAYRWKKNILIRGTYQLGGDSYFGQPDRRILIEPYWRFGW